MILYIININNNQTFLIFPAFHLRILRMNLTNILFKKKKLKIENILFLYTRRTTLQDQ